MCKVISTIITDMVNDQLGDIRCKIVKTLTPLPPMVQQNIPRIATIPRISMDFDSS